MTKLFGKKKLIGINDKICFDSVFFNFDKEKINGLVSTLFVPETKGK